MTYHRRHLDDAQVHRRWVDPRLHSVGVANVRAYLRGKGWKEVPPDRPGVLVFEEPVLFEDGPLYQWIPDSEKRRDFFQAVYELLAALAEIEDRYAGDVLTDLVKSVDAEASIANGSQTPAKGDPVRK